MPSRRPSSSSKKPSGHRPAIARPAAKRPAAKPAVGKPGAKPAKPSPKPSAPAKPKGAPPAAAETAPARPVDRSHLLSLSFLRDGDEFLARLETDSGQITELKNRSLDQLLSLVANELEDLLE
jgi:predicted component of type VI protein secretion system